MGAQTASGGVLKVNIFDKWLIALCALATIKREGEALVVSNGNICRALEDLESFGFIELEPNFVMEQPDGGLYSADIDRWLKELTDFCNPRAAVAAEGAEECERGYSKVSKAVIFFLQRFIVEELCFSDEAGRGQIFKIAEGISSGAKSIVESLDQAVDENAKRVFSCENNREFLSVLIPLQCFLFTGTIVDCSFMGTEIRRHQNLCYYCRRYLNR